jgi:Ni/Fe-hydrogenase b-type cytochrome subunit
VRVTDDGAQTVVMRGDWQTVCGRSRAPRADKSLLRRKAEHARQTGWRPLAVAQAPVGPDGNVGEFSLLGYVPIRVRNPHAHEPGASSWVRVPLWSGSLRFQHWSNLTLILALSVTGYYLMDPFFGDQWFGGIETGYLMGWLRFAHFVAAFGWLLLGLWRLITAFASRERLVRWPVLWPLKSTADVKNLGRVAQYYAFIKQDGPLYLGHNPLQQLAYSAIYVICLLQMATGLVLYGLPHQSNWFWQFVSTPVHWIGTGYVRLIHAITMFVLWAFVILHVYLAVRADSLERHGGVSAMINGGVWLKRGSAPVDGPVIE